MMCPPLEGIRVLDFSRLIAGPYCTMLLGDMGAEVIKVEQPGKGDDSRAFGPPFINGESVYFFSFNRNKKSITINLKTEEGKDIIRELIKKSDILVENFRPGYMEKIGFGFDDVHKLNPGLIYTSVSGYGHTGPDKFRPGYDVVAQGMGGLMSLTGDPDGPPYKVGTSLADIMGAIYAFQGTLLALIARQRDGKGQRVDVSLLDGQVSLLTYQAGIYFSTGKSPTRKGNQHPTISPYETFKASDEYINIGVGNDKFWHVFCELVSLKDIEYDQRFATNPKRVENRDELFPIIQKIIQEKTAEEWLKLFDEHGIPSGPILSVDKVLTHPQVLARDMVVEIPHRKAGNIKLTGIPVKLSDTPGSVKLPPPLLGEHNEEIFTGILGYNKEQIDSFRKEKII
ncbi:MAG: Formyl-coenzyme A transferase [bacterium ADurb.Bin363]|nr:MAG: Formyl-coenzyme A transferase [bacterium ADurb.Bin363]